MFNIILRSKKFASREAKGSARSIASWARGLIVLEAVALSLQSCSAASVDTCDRLQSILYKPAIIAQQTALPINQPIPIEDPAVDLSLTPDIDQADAIFESQQQAVLAKQLAQVPITDKTLSEHRNNLVELYRHDSDLGFQVSSFISPTGEIAVNASNRSAYEQVANQRIVIGQQVTRQVDTIKRYCVAQSPS